MRKVGWIFISLWAQGAYGQDCQEPFQPEQFAAIQRADGSGYEIRIFEGIVGGKRRHLILAGEQHVKTAAEHEAGASLVDAFPDRGVESLPSRSYWAGRWLRKSIDYRPDPDQTHGSTIEVAQRDLSVRRLEQLMQRMFVTQVDEGHWNREFLESLSEKISSDPSEEARFAQLLIASPDMEHLANRDLLTEVNWVRVVDHVLETLPDNRRVGSAPSQADPRVFFLEKGFKPNLKGQLLAFLAVASHTLRGVRQPLGAGVAIGVAIGLGQLSPSFPPFARGAALASASVLSLAPVFSAVSAKSFTAMNMKWQWDLESRDEFMFSEILRILEEDSEIGQFLIIVGKAHLDGLQSHLLNQGFSSRRLGQ